MGRPQAIWLHSPMKNLRSLCTDDISSDTSDNNKKPFTMALKQIRFCISAPL